MQKKNSKGISVISVIVTVVMIILIASITIYSGSNMLKQSREDRAYDRLEIIYQALRANEDILGIGETTAEEIALTSTMYSQIGLEYYNRDKKLPIITYQKRLGSVENTSDPYKRTYIMREKEDDGETNKYEKGFEYDIRNTTSSVALDFDAIAGVNRPQLTDDMRAIDYSKPTGTSEFSYVNDILLDRWYNYDSSAPNYANAELERSGVKHYYVWIPRYAYKIQDFYKENISANIPASAIEVIFLKSTTNLDANNNPVPSDYTIHPAFTYGNEALTGIWIEKKHTQTSSNLSTVYSVADSLYNLQASSNKAESHLLKNTEWAAFAYLAQTCGAAQASTSTNNNSGVNDINKGRKEYIAAYIQDSTTSSAITTNGSALKNAAAERKNVYASTGNYNTINMSNPHVKGDALVETSSGESQNSAWYNSTTVQPRPETPYIIRNTSDSVFGFSASSGAESAAYYRTALKVVGGTSSGTIIVDTDAKYRKVDGDTYLYEPYLVGFNPDITYYVTYDAEGEETLRPISNVAPSDWYNYEHSMWANILVQSGKNKAYFVWIPRYVYQLHNENTNSEYSDVRFVDINNNYRDENGNVQQLKIGEGEDEWRLPAAFTWDGKPIQGYWMSKYQVSEFDDLFYVARYPNKIIMESITASAQEALGDGPYSYYIGATLIGSAEKGAKFTYNNLEPNTVYKIRVVGNNGEEIERIIKTIGEIPHIANTTPNAPDLTGFNRQKTYYVTWNKNGVETLTSTTENAPSDWYDYSKMKWANIMVTNDQNKLYLVWIPRYKYLLQYADTDYTDYISGDTPFGYANVKFIRANEGQAGVADAYGYIVPQAFNWNGTEISGFWMSKYQVSAEE